jgi:outer membrane protein, protease secretion system
MIVAKIIHSKQRLLARVMVQAVWGGLLLHSGGALALGLQQAYDAALVNDPAYRAAFFANESGKESKVLGRANLLPNLSGSYSGYKNHTDITAGKNVTHPAYSSKAANLSLRQGIVNLDAVARYKQGIAQSQYSAAQYAGQSQEVALRVVGAYFEVLFKNDQLALAQIERDMYLEQKKVNDRMFQKGEGTKTDMLETQARLDLAEAQLLEAIDNQATARDTLAGIIGAEVGPINGLAPDFRVKPMAAQSFEAWKALALERNPAVTAQGYGVEVARQEVNKARAGHAPRLDFVASYSKNNSESINTINQESTVRSLGLQLNIPLYSGGSVNASSRQAVANQEKAKAELQVQIDKTLVDLRREYKQVISGVARIDALVKAVDSGTLLVKATVQSIKGGVRINLDLLNAQRQLYTSQRDLAQARYGYLLGTLRLRAAAGTLSSDDVREVASYFR